MRFEFATASRIIFGPGTLGQVGKVAAGLGRRALVVTGLSPERTASLLALLADQGVEYATFAITGEPTTEDVRHGVEVALQLAPPSSPPKIGGAGGPEAADLVIGFGGGSAIDAAKAIAALVTNGGDPLDYLEVIGSGRPLTRPSLPVIAIPTTAGTGAEVTRNAVLVSPEHRVKVSLRSPLMLPRVALVDPELTYSLPPTITASTGMDALTQVLEPYVSIRANPLTDALCREGLARAARSLRRACEDGTDTTAREDMALVSLFGGLALANAGLGVVHGLASVIGGMFPAPHGAICARLLPAAMAVNVRALQERQPDHPALGRYDEIARIMTLATHNARADAADGVVWVQELCRALQIPPLSAWGVGTADLSVIVEKAAVASSTAANPIKLTAAELSEILERSL